MKISAALIIHNDASLLDKCLASIEGHVDELIVVDGAYEWVAPFSDIFNEKAEESSDQLQSLLSNLDIPVKYYKGVWENETHKRRFSLEKASNDIVMNVDSDEIFEVDWSLVEKFCHSQFAIADCHFPLYFNPGHVGQATGLNSPPNKAIFINKSIRTVDQIVDSMFLMVPKGERKEKLRNSDIYPESVGIVHHLSNFRLGDGSYRRARFYNLLSFRVNGRINIGVDVEISSDSHFIELIENFPEEKKKALNNYFYFHRLSIGFPVIKNNQEIVKVGKNAPEIQKEIDEAFQAMVLDHNEKLVLNSDKEIVFYANKTMCLELSCFSKKGDEFLEFNSEDFTFFDVVYIAEYTDGRRVSVLSKRFFSGNAKVILPDVEVLDDDNFVQRRFMEITPGGGVEVGRFSYSILDKKHDA